MQKQGITLSQRQVEAFLTPSLMTAGGGIDYVTFASLARPRAAFGVSTPQYIRTVDYSSDGVPGPTTMHFQVCEPGLEGWSGGMVVKNHYWGGQFGAHGLVKSWALFVCGTLALC